MLISGPQNAGRLAHVRLNLVLHLERHQQEQPPQQSLEASQLLPGAFIDRPCQDDDTEMCPCQTNKARQRQTYLIKGKSVEGLVAVIALVWRARVRGGTGFGYRPYLLGLLRDKVDVCTRSPFDFAQDERS